jgi:glycosyltransferase involved in cell wall biosynthesis
VGEAGVLIDPEDEGALTAALARLLVSAEARAELARRGLARAAEFTAPRTAGRVVDLLLATATGGRALARRVG